MIILPLEQGSPEWLDYRRQHGMASETPSLLGSALYYPHTPFQLWLTKKGLAQTSHHPGMTRGLEFEAFARKQFAAEYALSGVTPVVVEEDTHLLAASLDGYWEDPDGPGILEVKHWADSSTMPALLSDVWPAHYDQVQHQLAVTEVDEACLMYGNYERQTYLWVPANLDRQAMIRHAWGQFWPYMDGEESPPLIERDYDEGVCQDRLFRDLEVAYALVHAEFEAAHVKLEQARLALIAFADGRNLQGGHVQVVHSYRSSIDMAALRADIDIARYRRVPKLVTTVRKV
jgi:predicted phage-related endonuclease